MFGIEPSTLRRWRRQCDRTGSVQTLQRSGRPRRIGSADEDALRDQVAASPNATLAQRCAHWQARHGVAGGRPNGGAGHSVRQVPGHVPRWRSPRKPPPVPLLGQGSIHGPLTNMLFSAIVRAQGI